MKMNIVTVHEMPRIWHVLAIEVIPDIGPALRTDDMPNDAQRHRMPRSLCRTKPRRQCVRAPNLNAYVDRARQTNISHSALLFLFSYASSSPLETFADTLHLGQAMMTPPITLARPAPVCASQ
jgi:hypothetical protein